MITGRPLDLRSLVGRPSPALHLGQILQGWDRVGWYWDRKGNRLCAYLTKEGKTYTVNIPWAKLRALLSEAICECGGEDIREQTLDGFFKKVGRKLKRAARAPLRFTKNPKKFVRTAARKIKNTVRGVGKAALKVASSPVFAGVMTGLSAVPPLQAVGGAGLAAYAAARAAKPAIETADKAIRTSKAVYKAGRGASKAIRKARRSRTPTRVSSRTLVSKAKAVSATRDLKRNLQQLPPRLRSMVIAALKSQVSAKPSRPTRHMGRRQRRRTALRLGRNGMLRRA